MQSQRAVTLHVNNPDDACGIESDYLSSVLVYFLPFTCTSTHQLADNRVMILPCTECFVCLTMVNATSGTYVLRPPSALSTATFLFMFHLAAAPFMM